jgi:hypothetical protein
MREIYSLWLIVMLSGAKHLAVFQGVSPLAALLSSEMLPCGQHDIDT